MKYKADFKSVPARLVPVTEYGDYTCPCCGSELFPFYNEKGCNSCIDCDNNKCKKCFD